MQRCVRSHPLASHAPLVFQARPLLEVLYKDGQLGTFEVSSLPQRLSAATATAPTANELQGTLKAMLNAGLICASDPGHCALALFGYQVFPFDLELTRAYGAAVSLV